MYIFGEMTDTPQTYFECGKNTEAAILLFTSVPTTKNLICSVVFFFYLIQ
jgi:hypothetical protein